MISLKERAAAELELRRRKERREEESKYRWYGGKARPAQCPPDGDWLTWLVLAGRGFGKTRTGAEWVRHRIEHCGKRRIAMVAPTADDARAVMVEGESGILSVCPPWNRPHYEPSRRRLVWPNGAIATTYSAEEPDRLRGPQHDDAWTDEIASWDYPEAWDMLLFGLRLGDDPRICATTTPKPVRLIRDLVKLATTVKTGGHTDENRDNLAPTFFSSVVGRFEGTRLGRQELAGELLEDVEGALWNLDLIDECRGDAPQHLEKVVVAVDPSGGDKDGNSEQGIVVVGRGHDRNGYVLSDDSCKLSPDGWGRRAVQSYIDHRADAIVCETNFGGDMVISTIRAAAESMAREGKPCGNVPVRKVIASRGKMLRAEPVAALYEQHRIKHVRPFKTLENQMTTFVPGEKSPDRLDALVWGMTDLMLGAYPLAPPLVVGKPADPYVYR